MRASRLSVVGALALTLASPAAATVFTATFSGQMIFFDDPSDIFQTGGGSSRLPFTVVYKIDTDALGAQFQTGLNTSQLIGGPFYIPGSASPASAKLTINDVTVGFSGSFASQIYQENNFSPPEFSSIDQVYYYAADNTDAFIQTAIFAFGANIVNSSLFSTYGTYVADLNNSYGGFRFVGADNQVASGTLLASSVVIAPFAAAVPEPASWTLMIVGFGAAGCSARQKRRARAATGRTFVYP